MSTLRFWCAICRAHFPKGRHELSTTHIRNVFKTEETIRKVDSAANNKLRSYYIKNLVVTLLDLEHYLQNTKETLKNIMSLCLLELDNIKFNILVYLEFEKPEEPDQTQIVLYKTKNVPVFHETNLNHLLDDAFTSVMEEHEEFVMKGSGWVLKLIMGTELRINFYRPLSKGSTYIPLPINSKHIVNVKNSDDKCFMYAMLGKKLPIGTKNKNRPFQYNQYLENYDFSCLEFPVKLKDISKFEKVNNLSVSVYGLSGHYQQKVKKPKINVRDDSMTDERDLDDDDDDDDDDEDDVDDDEEDGQQYDVNEKGVQDPVESIQKPASNKRKKPLLYPLKVPDIIKEDHTDLLFFTNGETSHYCWITNLEAVVRRQLSTFTRKMFMCRRCFSRYKCNEQLQQHMELCLQFKPAKPNIMFGKGQLEQFENLRYAMPHQYVVYADFECYLRNIDPDPERPNNHNYQKHVPMSYAYMLKSSDPTYNMNKPKLYRGPSPHIHFIEEMISIASDLSGDHNFGEEIRMTEENIRAHRNATHCAMCGLQFDEVLRKCRDHNHQYVSPDQPNYRQALCGVCNLRYSHPKSLIVVCHNWGKYDAHPMVRAVSGCTYRVSIIPSTMETYISMSIWVENRFRIVFIDSIRHLPSSLDNLVSSVPETSLVHARRLCTNDDQFNLVKKKGVYCYDYISDAKKLADTVPPPKEAFYNRLQNTHISDADYERFCTTWTAFGFKNLGEYADFYLKLDVCLLADVMQEFRGFCMNNYGLDCINYLTLPAFSYDAFLKMSRVQIELFTDIDMIQFISASIRGGISQCSLRHAIADNPLVTGEENRTPFTEPSTYIQYLDVTALYAYTMCKYLPYGGYHWISPFQINYLFEKEDGEHRIMKVPDDCNFGYILQVDLKYPQHLHDYHSDLPFCPEKKIPPSPSSKNPKLLLTLQDKKKYVIHYVALKQAISHGLVLEKIHRGILLQTKTFPETFHRTERQFKKTGHQ
ncbi:uncharacterized protein [Bemisia tabaci]|uniref:uncharacterized protein n=1 Tax=Bemisia tabaci TaxID=7038 RepID=UPI003B2855B5